MIAPIISIIIPTYNAGKTLKRCFDSIICQDFRDFEIIIMDAESKDNSLEIARDYANITGIVKIVSAKDEGIYDAMNKGIAIAGGEWIYFLGSDDLLASSIVLSTIFNNIEQGDNIIYGNCILVPGEIMEKGEWGYLQLLNMNINHQRVFYKKSIFINRAAFKLQYKIASDYELNIRLFCDTTIRKKYIDGTIAFYHLEGFSAGKIDEDFWNDWKTIFLQNFRPFLPPLQIYNRVAWYCWYQLKQKKYNSAFKLFCDIYFHTFSFRFLKHTASQSYKLLFQK